MNARIDKRYGSKAWKPLRRQVLARDQWACWKADCTRAADTCDHIERVEDRPDLCVDGCGDQAFGSAHLVEH